MSVLTKKEILREIKKGSIKVEPFNLENLSPGSLDLTLDNKFRIFKRGKLYEVSEEADHKKITKLVKTDSIIIKPGEAILGITKEKISLSDNICGWLEGRSRFARLGLMVHITAGFMQPGIKNKQVLEIANLGKRPLKLKSGTKICQFIFQETKGRAKYEGKFKDQNEP